MNELQKQQYEAAARYIDEHRGEMLAFWEKLVSTESGTADKEGCDAVASIMQAELESFGATVERVAMEKQGDLLKALWNGGNSDKAPVLFCGHMDTVFPKGTLEKNPFRIDEKGLAHGPGCLDMKAGLTIAVFTMKALAAAGYADRPLKAIFPGDEENGHRNSTANEEILAGAEGCRAAFNFETGFPDDGLVVGRKGSCRVTIAVQGVAAHAGNAPEKGRSAILEMAHKIIAIQALNDIPGGLYVNTGLIKGGTVVNAIPDNCSVDIDIRYSDRARLDALLEAFRKIVDHVTVEGTSSTMTVGKPSIPLTPNEAVMGLFEHVKAVAAETGYGDVHPIEVGGWADSCLIASKGVPVICAMGVKGEYNHSPREYAIADTLFPRAKLTAASVIALD